MKINMREIAGILTHYSPELSLSPADNAIRMAKLFSKDQISFEPGILYIGKVSDLPGFSTQSGDISLLCIEDRAIPLAYKENRTLNLILLEKGTDLSAVFNEIQDILAAQQALLEGYEKLLDSLIKGGGLQQIIDTGFELLGNPISVSDNSYELLVHTKNIEADDPVWMETIAKGRIPDYFLNDIKAERLIEKVYNSSSPIMIERPYSKYRVIMAKVVVDKKVVAHVGVLEALKPFREGDIELVLRLCNVISTEMQRNKLFRNTRRIMYEHFITDLLDGKIKNDEIIKEKARHIDLNLNESFYVLTINIEEYEMQNTTVSYARDQLEGLISGSKSVIYNDQIVLIISRRKEEPLAEANLKELSVYLRKNKMYGGLSRCFHHIADIQKYYRQSVSAIELGIRMNKGKVLFIYEDFAVYHLMDIRSAQENIKDFCHPALFTLMEYDRQNDTCYTRSLYVYLENARNNVVAARVLHIHRNSMSYRIEKIQELIKTDLDDKDLLFHLHLSFKILGFSGEVDFGKTME